MNKYLELILILIFTTIFLIGCGTKYLEYNNSFRTFDSTAYFVNSNNKSKIRIVAKTKKQLKESLKLVVLSEENTIKKDLSKKNLLKTKTTPYFYNDIKTNNGKNITSKTNINKYIETKMKTDLKYVYKNSKKEYFIDLDYYGLNALKITNIGKKQLLVYDKIISKYSKEFNIDKTLVYAIIKTESNFYKKAKSKSNAIGLMQIVPKSAGNDSYRRLYGKNIIPTIDYLFDVDNNIKLGVHYLSILDKIYLKKIKDNKKRELCMIASYNTGYGNLLNTLSEDNNLAFKIINQWSYSQLYEYLRINLPYQETRDYICKVNKYIKKLS